jgi:hypothetical protein
MFFTIISCKNSSRFISENIESINYIERGFFFKEIESRNYYEKHTISILYDTLTKQYFIAMLKDDLLLDFQKTFVDIKILPRPKEFEEFIICTFGENHPYDVVVGMEFNESDSITSQCDSILYAVIFNSNSRRFEDFDMNGLYRINEHYYRNFNSLKGNNGP